MVSATGKWAASGGENALSQPVHIRLSIVFLNFNRLRETSITVKKLYALTAHRKDIEVVAVDNGSSDGTSTFLSLHSDWLRLLLLDGNIGIGGLNRGFDIAKGDYLLVLDDDSHPSDIQTIDKLITLLDEKPDVGVIACRIDSPDGKPFRSWHYPETDKAGPSMAFIGCGFAIRRDLFKRIGWFPEEFFLYQNEIETAIRVMREGYGIYYEPACRVIHRESSIGRTSWRRVYFPTRNTLWIIRRYFHGPAAVYMMVSRLFFGLTRALQAGLFQCYFLAIKDGFGSSITPEPLPGLMHKRLNGFIRNNSLFHHLLTLSRKK